MNRPSLWLAALLALSTVSARTAGAQDSAPSSHLVFDDRFDGDIIINEVRVPSGGEAMYTYYEALGWRGKAAGYAGIQVHPRAHLYLFSIWDHKEHTAPIRAVFRGAGTETVGFGGEGTGLKSWNFKLGWKPDVWYTLVARTWPVGNHTYYGFWVRAGTTRKWTHLVTMDVGVAGARFRGGTDAFIEDWSNTGAKPRTTTLRGGWKRKLDGAWFPFGAARYSVNAWDLDPGKRSYHFRRNFDGGVKRDKEGDYYYMVSGGAKTTPTTTNPSQFAIRRREMAPPYEKLQIDRAAAVLNKSGALAVRWRVVPTTTPPFSYRVDLYDNPAGRGTAIATSAHTTPHARSVTVDLSDRKLPSGGYFARLCCVDILDRTSQQVVIPFTIAAAAN